MATVYRVSMTAAIIVCLLSTQWNGTIYASEAENSPSTAAVSPLPLTIASAVQAPTSLGWARAVSIGELSVETTDVSSAPEPQDGRARLLFDALAVNEVLGTV